MSGSHPLWDLPTRLFHWLIVICVCVSWWSGEQGDFDWHSWSGYTVIVLVLFRLIWGFIGSQHSRFSDFLRGPTTVRDYLRGNSVGSPGHNPLGGWSVLVLLSLLLIQAVSGLFNSDDVMFQGPFYYAASGQLRDNMGVIHEFVFYVLLGFIALHLLAVIYHQWLKHVPLLQAMIRGQAPGLSGERATVPTWLALVVVVLVAALLWWIVSLAPQPAVFW